MNKTKKHIFKTYNRIIEFAENIIEPALMNGRFGAGPSGFVLLDEIYPGQEGTKRVLHQGGHVIFLQKESFQLHCHVGAVSDKIFIWNDTRAGGAHHFKEKAECPSGY